jgi:hypothetical protein
MATFTVPPVRARKPQPAAPEAKRPAPHWQFVIGGPIADVLIGRVRG